MNKYFRGILVALLVSFSFSMASAQKAAVLELFHGAECPHCHDEMKFLPTIQAMYPDLEVKKYEIWHDKENKELAEKRLKDLGTRLDGVPTNIIEDEVIVGFNKNKILQTLEKHYGKPAINQEQAITTTKDSENPAKKWVLGVILLIIIGGAIYSFSKK